MTLEEFVKKLNKWAQANIQKSYVGYFDEDLPEDLYKTFEDFGFKFAKDDYFDIDRHKYYETAVVKFKDKNGNILKVRGVTNIYDEITMYEDLDENYEFSVETLNEAKEKEITLLKELAKKYPKVLKELKNE